MGKFIFNKEFKLHHKWKGKYNKPFKKLDNKYGYFSEQDQEKHSEEFSKYVVSSTIIHNKDLDDYQEEDLELVYRMYALFPEKQSQIDTLIGRCKNSITHPLHDLFQSEIPKNEGFHLDSWRNLILKEGFRALNVFASAPQIERLNDSKPPKDWQTVENLMSQLKYPRWNENREFATLCSLHKAPEHMFDKSLDYLQDGTVKPKTTDTIPDIAVDIGEQVDEKHKGYYLVKLPPGDLRGLILGQITNCCQSITGFGEEYAIKGTNEENTSFYLMLKSKKKDLDINNIDWANLEKNYIIVGQGNIWRGKNNSMVIGSWENMNPSAYDEPATAGLEVLAQKMTEQDKNTDRFLIGAGGKTPEALILREIAGPDLPVDNFEDGDARNQVLLSESKELTKVKEGLRKKNRGGRSIAHLIYRAR